MNTRSKDEEDKRKRECNLLVHGMSVGEDDKGRCEEIFRRELELGNIKIESVMRLRGRRGEAEEGEAGRRRGAIPLLVKMEGTGQKWAVVGRAKRLKDAREAENRKIMIVPDLSVKEREADRILRGELRRRRDEGERNIYISRGQIKRRGEY